MYLLLHAFSRRNSGDGLLVDLTVEALEAAGIAREDCALLALDPDSFSDFRTTFRAPGEPFAQLSPRLAFAGMEVLTDIVSNGRLGTVARRVRSAKGLVAVGGGYLVTDSPTRQMGVLLNHMNQLSAAARSRVPSVYLPQSIGPLVGPVGRMVAQKLRRVDRIYARDDATLSEVGSENVRRCADLAVMKLARQLAATSIKPFASDGTIIVGRNLPNAGDYLKRLRLLAEGVPRALWAVQADTKGTRSDREFYRRMGYESAGPLSSVLASNPGVVVSVRLHGAITALLAGCPAIHLAYERKGWGAYADLGISPYVHDARTFDPGIVMAQIKELRESPGGFWRLMRTAVPSLMDQYRGLVDDLRDRLASRYNQNISE